MFAAYPNAYVWQEDGKLYPVFYIWDGELLRGAWDNYSGSTKTAAALKWLADQMKSLGYDGAMVMSGNSTANAIMNRATLRDNGHLRYCGLRRDIHCRPDRLRRQCGERGFPDRR